MNYVFDTSALIWLTEQPIVAGEWVRARIPSNATIYYHPITLAEVAAQTHAEYVACRQRTRTPAGIADTVKARQSLLIALTLPPSGRPPALRRRIVPFDTGTKATNSLRKTVYEQLTFEKQERRHLYRISGSGDVMVLAGMVDHLILSVASFLVSDSIPFAAFVTRDRHQFLSAKRLRVPSVYPPKSPDYPDAKGAWIHP